ncbi:DNA primase [Streptomyces griseoincarnatus]|uniref:DNA primase n=1 Tax=unclassified Streptomyces TaxID=2593676 RepID=UPI0012EAAF63|nr:MULTISPECIES: DNA primase [unclassified Streptomyces]MBQ0974445.1 DNA primase [Streptomyces sp. RK31]MUT89439.1 DNA primase [Streptomyces sp. Z38]
MNRTGMGLAIGAGYLLGRTKKLKMALAVGGLVAGKKLNLSPRAVADLVSQQLRDNPQFKELGDQLRGELQGVGKAASGALVERQISSLADRLHDRTAEVRGRLDGGGEDRDGTDEHAGEEPDDRGPDDAGDDRDDDGGRERGPDTARTAKKAAKKAPAKKGPAAKKAAPAKRAAGGPAKKTAAKKTAAKKTASASRGARSRPSKGGGE